MRNFSGKNCRGLLRHALLFFAVANSCSVLAQKPAHTITGKVNNLLTTSETRSGFVENIGQYGQYMYGYEDMGLIQYGYEGNGMPVLFTSRGFIYLQRKISMLPKKEERKLEKQGLPEQEIEKRRKVVDKTVVMEWLGADKNAKATTEEQLPAYNTYGVFQKKAYLYKKITYHDIYPGIDLVYHFNKSNKAGFEYSLIIHPGADISVIRAKYNGDIKRMQQNEKGELTINTGIDGITFTAPVCYYQEKDITGKVPVPAATYKLSGKDLSFSFNRDYDHTKTLVIDPFVSSTSNLSGLNTGKAKDVDFDYAGNVYVTGGGDGTTTNRLAKFNAAGVLQWTFNGTLSIPVWNYGPYYGGSVVDKPTGNVYLGQGFNYPTGFQVIRINTAGLYDNYITTPNGNFTENWKMYWSCNNGTPQILIAGGGINSNVNFGIFTPPSTTISSLNVTGLPGAGQDIVDLTIDPSNNDMYTAYASLILSPEVNNKLYKNTAPYSAASIAWNLSSPYNTLSEAANRPYLATSLVDNSANIFSINASYLYYWDGKNLRAINKTTGATVGTGISTSNSALFQGGIIADACDNIYVGDANGTIKTYHFDGSTFIDAAIPDITVTGYSTKSVYDLAYNESTKMLYASGDGFVASFDVSSISCGNNIYTINVVPNCATASATATVSPIPPPGSTVTYVLLSGSTQVATNTTGIFNSLQPNTTYTLNATVNLACSGVQSTTTFVLPGPNVSATVVNATCGNSSGQINVTASGSAGPYTYSIDGVNFQASNIFTSLASGIYIVTVKDVGGCKTSITVNVLNADGPAFTYSSTNATCGNSVGSITITATGGVPPYQYSSNNGVTYQLGNTFNGLVAGLYTVVVKDANNCTNATTVTILAGSAPNLTATPAAATCGTNNGSITAFGTGGLAPLTYSINGNIFQASGLFTNLTPGAYTVTVKDAAGCIKTVAVTIANNPAPTVTATSTTAACANANGSITATGLAGVPPLSYSIDGINFQASNIFFGLTAGAYTITVKDASGCTNTATVTVGSTGGPTVTATATASSCASNTGTITAVASGTVGTYQYSITGTTYQVSGTFSGLAPGNYIVFGKDGNGCLGAVAVTVPATAGPSVTASMTAASCSVNDGTITANGSSGTPPYQYSLDGTTFQASNTFTGLAANTYTVTVKDANQCRNTFTIVVPNVAGLTLSVSTISTSCNAVNGVITAVAAGGQAPLQYSLDGVTYQAGNVFNALASATYTVYVKDANGCIISRQATVGFANSPTLSVTTTNATCASANGIIIASGSGGLAPLRYSINGTVYQTSGTFINVAAGTYTVYLKDSLGCIVTQQVTITTSGTGPGISTFTVNVRNAYPCNGSLGRITNPRVNGSNCNSCTFSLNFGAFIPNAAQLYTNLAAGTYYVTAKDANGCTKTIVATIINAPVSTASATVTGSACNASDGTITLTGIGPNTPYHASISGIGGPWVTFDPSYTFTGLAPGIYDIILADDESFDAGPPVIPGGCLDTVTVVVPSIGGPSLTVSQTPGTCGAANASITAEGSGGTPPFLYNINGGAYQSDGTFTDLAAGDYTVTVLDDAGCITVQFITVTTAAGPTTTAVTQPTSCGLPNGSITVTGSGGTPPYEYSINGTIFQSGNIFNNLAAGTYNLYIKDAAGCFSIRSVTITSQARPVVTAVAVAASCNGSDGSIFAIGSQGTPPYTYSMNGTVYQSSGVFSGLVAGFYTVYVKDARDCVSTTGVSIGNNAAPTFTTVVTAAKCGNANGVITVTATGGSAPLQYSIDGVNFQLSNILTGIAPGTYTVTVKDALGCSRTRSVLVGNTAGPRSLTATVVNAACGLSNGSITAAALGGTAPLQYSVNGVTYQASTLFSALAANSYTLYVKDVNGCIRTLPVTVLNLTGPGITATATGSSCNASDGSITAVATGGTNPLTYSRNGVTFQSSNVFTAVPPGTYTITVKDARGCTSTTSVTVTAYAAPSVTAVAVDASCGNSNGSITATGIGGVGPYTYSLDGVTYQASATFTNLAANSYLVRVKDANGCTGTIPVTISNTAPMSGTYTVGAGGNFTTLTAAVNAYNTRCINGPIIFMLTDAAYNSAETFPIKIKSNIYASAINTLTIKPSVGNTPVITGNNDTAVIAFAGADYISIDGSNTVGGISRDLTITTSTAVATDSYVIRFYSPNVVDGATQDAIMNCNIIGNTVTSTAIMSGGFIPGSVSDAQNNNNRFINNAISKAQSGIALLGGGPDQANEITGNSIGSAIVSDKLSNTGILINGQSLCFVQNNTITGIINSGTANVSGITVNGASSDIMIAGNTISDIRQSNSAGLGANGIYLSTSISSAQVMVVNNFVSGISAYGNTAGRLPQHNGYGIVVDGGSGYNIYHNTVVLNTNQDIAGYPSAINITSLVTDAGAIDLRDNIFGNVQTQSGSHYTIQSTANTNVFSNIDYNDYYTGSGSLGYVNATDLPGIVDIRTGFGGNINSINITPVYLSATDLHIDPANVSNGVNLGDRGTDAGIAIDIDNTTRSVISPDMGADEWIKPNYGSWVGRVSIDWLVPENWETNVVPDGNTDVLIKGGFTHMPTIVTTQAVRNLDMHAPDINNVPILTLSNGTIQINGVINHTAGTIDGINGTVEMNGTASQQIPANLFQNNALNNLVIGNTTAAGVDINGTLDIYRSVTFSPGGLKLNTNDFLTFKSTATETAWLGNMTGKTLTGTATVERYIPNHSKAWQLLSVPTTGQSIKDSWQEGSAAPNSNPVPGYGTQITSNVANATNHPEPGYDLFSANGPSIKVYNSATGAYDAIPSTAMPIANAKGYMLFVRGDRSVTAFGAPATETVLRTKGTLFTPANPPQVMAIPGGLPPLNFASVGNPYASAIDLTKLTLNESGGGVQDIFYLWDPLLTTAGNSVFGLGGFQTLTRNGATYDVTPGGGSYGPTNKLVQSGQAFFVSAPFAPGTVKFTEDCKTDGSSIVTRESGSSNQKQLTIKMFAVVNGTKVLIDGNRVQCGESYSNLVDIQDARKLNNTGENISIRKGSLFLSVERRKPFQRRDTVFLRMNQVKVQQYEFEITAKDLRDDDLAAYLEDSYLQTSRPLNLNGTTLVAFSVENIAGSYNPDRFRIVFRKSSSGSRGRELPIAENLKRKISVFPNPVTGKQLQLHFAAGVGTDYNIKIANTNGQVLYRGVLHVSSAETIEKIKLKASFPSGSYELSVSTGNEVIYTDKIVVK